MKQIRIFIIVLAALGINSTVFANELAPIRLQMLQGEYKAAYAQAEALTTSEGHTLAAKILLSEIMLGQAEKNKKQAKRARKSAEAALELNPENQNARLQYAIADGFIARESGDVSAWINKIPQKTEAIIQAYRADFPTDPHGDALLAAWHLGIARKAGNKTAKKMFGASIADGRKLFQTVWETESGDIIIGVNYAFSLLALKDKDFSDIEEAHQILKQVMIANPKDHMGHVLKNYAAEALTKIDDRDVVRDYAEMFLDGDVPEFPSDD